MQQYVGKKCKVKILRDNNCLHYTADPVTDVTQTHISFIDKFGEQMTFRIIDIVELNTCEGGNHEKEETFK